MHIGYHVMAWRRYQKLTQSELAVRAALSRPYLSRLEKGNVDPALSVVRQLSVALNVGLGRLIEELPPERTLSRDEMDRLARGAWNPGTEEARSLPETRVLALMIRERRKALGRGAAQQEGKGSPKVKSPALHSSRWLRASLGEKQWNALLRRIDKLAATSSAEDL